MPTTAFTLEALADSLAEQIDPSVESDLLRQWNDFWSNTHDEPVSRPQRKRPFAVNTDWPSVSVNDTLSADAIDSMIASQLAGCAKELAGGGGRLLCVRCNYGVGILATLFGAEEYIMPAEQNSLPNVRPIGIDGVRNCLQQGIPDLSTGSGARVFDTAARFNEILARHPVLAEHVHLYHPDLQGPMDICELLWGSDIFVDLYDEPERVHEMLELITETYIAFMRKWHTIAPVIGEFSTHWGMLQKGRIMIRDDSAMNLSPEMFDEFIAPYDGRLLEELGGGCIHACGRVDHYIESASHLPKLHAFNMSQPSYNDMETVYRHTVDQGIRLIGLCAEEADRALASGRSLRGLVHAG